MNLGLLVITASCALVGLGARLGSRRFALLAAAAALGWSSAWCAGESVAAALAGLVGADTLLVAALGRLLAYLVGFTAVLAAASRWSPQWYPLWSPGSGTPLSRRSRWEGAALALVFAVATAWLALGDVSTDLRAPGDSAGAESQAGLAELRPVAVLRSCRVLCSLDPAEAERLAARREVRAVLDSPSLERLFRRPGLVGRFAAAADGDWESLAALAVDPAVKQAMDDPEFLRRVQAVDLVAMASEVEAQRRGDAPLAGDLAAAPLDLPAFTADADLRRRIAAEWSGEETAVAPPTAAERHSQYWRQVEIGLHLLEASARVLP